MKVNSLDNRDASFKGVLNNKAFKKGLEFAADNGTLFGAVTSLVLSSTARPLAIMATPGSDKKNKELACAKSITSTLNGYLITLLFSLPLSWSIKKINDNPTKYLKKETIKNLSENTTNLKDSKAYSMSTQLFKLGLGFLIAAPKSIITAIGTPLMLDMFSNKEKKDVERHFGKSLIFKGKNPLSSGIGKIIDNERLQKFVKKHNDSNFPLHIVAATDIVSTTAFIQKTKSSKKIAENEKRVLINNTAISTILSIIMTYLIDAITKKSTDKFQERYKAKNLTDPNLAKQLEGIRIAKPIIIAGCIYYVAIPMIATFFAERIKK